MKKIWFAALGILIAIIAMVVVLQLISRNMVYKAQNKIDKISSEAERAIKFTVLPNIASDPAGKPEETPVIATDPVGKAGEAPVISARETPETITGAQPVVKPTGAAECGQPITAPLKVDPRNPRYFMDGTGKVVYLTGSHTWASLQDNGQGNPPPPFDYSAYIQFLGKYHHNFFRLWSWEQSRWTMETADNQYWFYPATPYVRTGPGAALDGEPKFDLTQFNQAYFDRMRERIVQARDCGIYVSIMLFDGWSVASDKGGYHYNNPWKGHPFNAKNNINGIDGDPNNRNDGLNTQDLSIPAVTAIQEAYVKKVIDTVGDLDNVLYEIDNEGDGSSVDWQYHMIRFIKQYETARPKQHPVGMTAAYPGGWNPDLFDSPADWISPNNDSDYLSDPPAADGVKVVLNDTDHLCGVCGERSFVWKSFTRGLNPIYMDVYDGAGYGTGAKGWDPNDPQWDMVRKNMGYALETANRVDLQAMKPSLDRCSSGYCLFSLAPGRVEFLVYLPDGGNAIVDLSGTDAELQYQWLNLDNGQWIAGGKTAGGANRTFTPPVLGDTVLYLYQAQ